MHRDVFIASAAVHFAVDLLSGMLYEIMHIFLLIIVHCIKCAGLGLQ